MPPGSAAAAPHRAPGRSCAGSRAARPRPPAQLRERRGRAHPAAAPPAGSRRWRCALPAGPGTTAAAAHTTAGPRQAAPAPSAPAAPPPPRPARCARPSTVGASNRLRIASSTSRVARIRLISRVASSEWPPSAKKLSSIPTRSSPSTSRKQRAQHLLARRARTAHDRRGEIGRRQRTPVELAVRRQRQSLQHHKRRRHHVVRQARRHMRAQRRRIGCRAAAGRHHIGHQPLVAGRILARDHRRLRDPGMPHQRGLDLARLDPEPAQLHLRVRAPQELQHPVGAPARQVAGAVHPAPRRRHTGRPRTARPSAPPGPDSRAPDRLPRCKARPSHPQEQAAARQSNT